MPKGDRISLDFFNRRIYLCLLILKVSAALQFTGYFLKREGFSMMSPGATGSHSSFSKTSSPW